MSHAPVCRQRGGGLIEVLVSLLILSITLLGLARLQTLAMVHAHDAWLHTQAQQRAHDIFEHMRSHRQFALEDHYTLPLPNNGDVQNPPPPVEPALTEWLTRVEHQLPGAEAAIRRQGASLVVELQWRVRAPASPDTPATLSIRSRP